MKTRNFASPGFPGFAFVAWFGSRSWQKSNPGFARVAHDSGMFVPSSVTWRSYWISPAQTHGFASPAFTGFAIIGREVKVLCFRYVIDRFQKNFILSRLSFFFATL
jgi:hypothetical protein